MANIFKKSKPFLIFIIKRHSNINLQWFAHINCKLEKEKNNEND
jgi:hypothetical protein